MRRWGGLLFLSLLAGCNGKTSLSPACAIDQSVSACDRCQARRCAAQLDQCYGPELREGSRIPDNAAAACRSDGSASDAQALTTYYSNDPRLGSCGGGGVVWVRCQWDEATRSYTRDCVYGGGGADGGVSFAGACRDFSRCVQSCGCLTDCSPSCARVATEGCTLCRTQVLQPCVTRMCAEECGAADGGR
jgi:hypothetical protein